MSSAGDAAHTWEPPEAPDISSLVTEDEEPVDNIGSEKQQRFFTSSLYSSWKTPGGVDFFAAANVGIYGSPRQAPVVPDVLVSLDVRAPEDWWQKKNRCYLLWEFGKSPELAIEIVSNRDGTELSAKLRKYQRLGINYYAVYDPTGRLSEQELHCFELRGSAYKLLDEPLFPQLELGLTFWEGAFEGSYARWLRFTDARGALLLTGDERAQQANERAEHSVAIAAKERARAEKLAEKLRALGVDLED